ncbi:MAG TPA: hypothetical protein VFB73_16075 [Chloroflexota bacterium]|nr:hypothetical protein [Chloroflexota bacterium]
METLLDAWRERLARKAAARRQAAEQRADEPPAPPGDGPSAPASASPPALPSAGPAPGSDAPQPRVVRRIVWGYRVGELPVPWLMGYKRLKATLERAGFAIRVELLPLTELPPDVDLLFVPSELAEMARAAAPAARVIALAGRPEPAVFQALVDQLRAGTELAAPSPPEAAQPPTAPRGVVVRYRGRMRID